MDYKAYIELVKKRRSVRSFTDKLVSINDLNKIVDAARYAPSGMNSQPWEFIIIKNQQTINHIFSLFNNRIKDGHNSNSLIIVLGDKRKKTMLPGIKFDFKNGSIKFKKPSKFIDSNALFTSSLSSAFTHMLLAATSLGLSTQYISMTSSYEVQKKIKDLLQIPEYMIIYDTLAIGYAAYVPQEKYIKPLEKMVHIDTYNMNICDSDEQIILDKKNHLYTSFMFKDKNTMKD